MSLEKKIYTLDNIIDFGTSFEPKSILYINGFKVASIKDCYEVKKFLNRKKDIELLKKFEKIM